MEDKSFELLTRMYGEFTEFKKDITKEVRNVSNQVTKLENGLKEDVKALFDGYKQTYEKLEVLDSKVDRISKTP